MGRSEVRLEIGRDVVVLVAGLALVLCTPWLNTKGDQEVTGAMLVYGLLLAGTALWAMNGASRPSHWVHLIVGILVLVSPWMLQFPAGYDAPDVIAVVAGLAATIAGMLGILASRRQPRSAPTEKRGSYLAW